MKTKKYSIERKMRILETLEREGRVEVELLAADLRVSKETVRRDLRELENDNLLLRTHGGAVSLEMSETSPEYPEYPYLIREIQCLEEKEKICKRAASEIEDGDTIFIDNSSTNLFILKNINPEYSVTIITNSIRLLLESTKYPNENFVFVSLGGIFRCKNFSCVGDIANEMSRNYRPDKAFLSCYGVNTTSGLFDSSVHEIEVKRNFIRLARQVYLTADHTKIGRDGGFRLVDLSDVDYLISDCMFPEEELKNLESQHVKLLI